MPDLGIALAWVGAALVVLSDGGRGLALGLALVGLGLGLEIGVPLGWAAGLLLAGGGVLAALPHFGSRARGWRLMRPGSTPRLMLCVVVGGAMLWAGGSLLGGPGAAPVRMAVMLVSGIAGARLLTAMSRDAALAAAGALALGLGAGGAMEGGLPVLPAIGAGVLTALGTGLIGGARPDAV